MLHCSYNIIKTASQLCIHFAKCRHTSSVTLLEPPNSEVTLYLKDIHTQLPLARLHFLLPLSLSLSHTIPLPLSHMPIHTKSLFFSLTHTPFLCLTHTCTPLSLTHALTHGPLLFLSDAHLLTLTPLSLRYTKTCMFQSHTHNSFSLFDTHAYWLHCHSQPHTNKSKILRVLESETKTENGGKSQWVWQHLWGEKRTNVSSLDHRILQCRKKTFGPSSLHRPQSHPGPS